jgi:hypothetical protein
MDTIRLNPKLKSSLMLIALTISVIFTYMVLHELGHLVAAKLFGAHISDLSLNLFSAHVAYSTSDLTNFQNSIVDIAGITLPFLSSFALFFIFSRNTFFSTAAFLLLLQSVFSLIPFFIPMGNTDTVNLIRNSGMHQLSVSVVFGFLFFSGLFFLLQKNNREKITQLFRVFLKKYSLLENPKYTKQTIAIAFFIATVTGLGFFSFFDNNLGDGYEEISSIKLGDDLQYPLEILRFNSSGKDTLIFVTTNLVADSIEVTYFHSTENKVYEVFKGNELTIDGSHRFSLIPNQGELSIIMNGTNMSGNFSIFKRKQVEQ